MRLTTLSISALALSFLTVGIQANPVSFSTQSYNFPLGGGGGGESALLDNQNVETFCVDFANDIYVPHTGYSAYLSMLTDGSDLSHTRFGSNSSWQPVTINDSDSNDATDAVVINGAVALGRYQMAAFLVSQYQQAQGNNAYNNGIQAAIWDILDPSSYAAAPNYASPTEALELAAEWYNNPNSDKSFLANFRIVSDANMTWSGEGKPLNCGFQEQLTMVPEPRTAVWMLVGLFALFAIPFRKRLVIQRVRE